MTTNKDIGKVVYDGGSAFLEFVRSPEFTAAIEARYPSIASTETALPVGSVVAFGGSSPPENWLVCDGSTFDISQYPDLRTVLQSSATPDLRGRMIVGVGNDGTAQNGQTRDLNNAGGDTRLQAHDHSIRTPNASYALWHDYIGGGSEPIVNLRANVTSLPGAYSGEWKATSSGSGGAENMPPFRVLNYIIKAR